MSTELDGLRARLRASGAGPRVLGRVVSVRGFTVRATAQGARVGELVTIGREGAPLRAEVVGFEEDLTVLMPWGDLAGVGLDDVVTAAGERPTMRCGDGLLGRVLDAMGEPRDGLGPLAGECETVDVQNAPPDPLRRGRVDRPMALGVRAIDALATVGAGQRVGVFAGPGAGKSSLLTHAARRCDADAVVLCLVGERGREVRELLDGLDGAARSRVCAVVSTSDEAPVLRVRAAMTAMRAAEHFRDRGRSVLLLVDSVTRVARAQRELGLAAGEPAVRRGFPPSVFTMLPRWLERAGPGERGAITALCTVLVEGDSHDDPIADEVRGLLDGHLVLDASLGARGRWPALDVTRSLSRVMPAVTDDAHRADAARVRAWIAALDANRDLLALGAYTKGRDRLLDEALAQRDAIERFLTQRADEPSRFEDAVGGCARLARAAR